MPVITQSPQTRPDSAPPDYRARPASGRITVFCRHAHQLIPALTRSVRRLHLLRLADYKLEPMPRLRWYS